MEEKISKLVIKPSEIKIKGFSLSSNANLSLCPDCKSPIAYVKINWGIIEEDHEYFAQYNRSKRVYALREIGFNLYCAECGEFIENYSRFFYPEDKLVFYDFHLEELDDDERAEIQVCLSQFNQTEKFTPRYKSQIFTELKSKLIEYENKHLVLKTNRKIVRK